MNSPTGASVYVNTYDASGNAADSQFTLLYLTDDPKSARLIGSHDGIDWDPASDTCIADGFTPDTHGSIEPAVLTNGQRGVTGKIRGRVLHDEVDRVQDLPVRLHRHVVRLGARRFVPFGIEAGHDELLVLGFGHQYLRSSGSHLPRVTSFFERRGPAGSWWQRVW